MIRLSVGIAVAALLLAAAVSDARAQTYLEIARFDRERPCRIPVVAAPDGYRCTYNTRATIHLELVPVPRFAWIRVLAQTEFLSREAGDERGHFIPIEGDLAGGLVFRWHSWTVTLLAGSRHCMDVVCGHGTSNDYTPVRDAYNALVLRWTAPQR